IAPQRAHTGGAFRAATGANVVMQAAHRRCVERLARLEALNFGWAADEETGRELAVDAEHRRELRRIAAHRRKGALPLQRGEILVQAAQLLRALGDEAVRELRRELPL